MTQHRWLASLLCCAALIAVLAPGAGATPQPARSGTIAGTSTGLVLEGAPGCQLSPDCAAWRARHCDPGLAGQDPALFASIVDVKSLAGSWRQFSPPWGGWLDTSIEFFTGGCAALTEHRVSGGGREPVLIPRRARWMVVTTVLPSSTWQLW